MPAAFSIRVLDSIIRIEVDGSLSVDEIAGLQSPWRSLQVDTDEKIDATVRVGVGDIVDPVGATAVVGGGYADEAAQSLTTTVTLQGIGKLRGRALLLHAAAVALDDGRVVGFIGPSGRGKTTASRALAQRYGYVTDETLAVRSDLSVIPYPKPLSVLVGQPPKHSIAPESLGMRSLPAAPLRLAAMVLLDRRPDATEATVGHVDLAEAVGLIAPETSSLVALARPIGDLVDAVQQTGGVRRVTYAEASQLADLVPAILAASRPPGDDVEILTPDDGSDPFGGSDEDSRYSRVPWSDAARIGERLVIHNGSRLFVLEGLGPALWRAADGRGLDEVIAEVTRDLPPPPGVDARAAITERISDLMDAGVLFRR